jgi:two-component system LytT family response regulator
MKQYQFLIVDDEPDAIDGLKYQVKKLVKQNTVFFCAKSVEDALLFWQTKSIDLIFLDIHLGKELGFDLLDQIPFSVRPPVIFVTAFDDYAIRALNSAALYYLLKPVSAADLSVAIDKFMQHHHFTIRQEQLQVLLENIIQPTSELNRVLLPLGNQMEMIPKNQIVRCESDSNYTHVYSLQGIKYTLAKTLKEVETCLPPVFFRIHRSHLVNLNMMQRVHKKESMLELVDGTRLPISEDRKGLLIERTKLIR